MSRPGTEDEARWSSALLSREVRASLAEAGLVERGQLVAPEPVRVPPAEQDDRGPVALVVDLELAPADVDLHG